MLEVIIRAKVVAALIKWTVFVCVATEKDVKCFEQLGGKEAEKQFHYCNPRDKLLEQPGDIQIVLAADVNNFG